MSTESSIRILQIITALDSLSYGLIYGFLSPYIIKLGGNQVSVGILAVGNLIGDLLSPEVVKIFTHLNGRRYALFVILHTALLTHLMMVMTSSYWFTILVRILFSITNQSQNLCLDLLLNKAQNDKAKELIRRNYSILSGSGYIIGPIISGYIFPHGFGYVGIMAASLALVNSILLLKVTKDQKDTTPEHMDKSVLQKAVENVTENINYFRSSDYGKNWDILLCKYLFASSLMIFFTKFTLILTYNYKANPVMIGYTAAYINILVFAATYYTAMLKTTTEKYPVVFLSEVAFFLLSAFMFLACYSPYYELFMMFLAPVILIRTFIISMWKELFFERKNDSLSNLNNTASVVAGLTTPLLFGVVANQISHHAAILFSCIPPFLCWVIVRKHSRFITIDDDSDDDKDC